MTDMVAAGRPKVDFRDDALFYLSFWWNNRDINTDYLVVLAVQVILKCTWVKNPLDPRLSRLQISLNQPCPRDKRHSLHNLQQNFPS